jgi:hypothetical protein
MNKRWDRIHTVMYMYVYDCIVMNKRCEWYVIHVCSLTPTQQFFSNIMANTTYKLIYNEQDDHEVRFVLDQHT